MQTNNTHDRLPSSLLKAIMTGQPIATNHRQIVALVGSDAFKDKDVIDTKLEAVRAKKYLHRATARNQVAK